VPVHEYNPVVEETSNEEKTPIGDKNATPKSENTFKF
jgi:hypothetical protein